jgi:hypothetical protein
MPAYPQTAAFLQLVRAANPTYSRVKTSSLAPLVAILNSANGTANQVIQAINQVKAAADPVYVNKANKYKIALNFLQRTYPIPQGQWVRLGAQRSRAARFTQTAVPNPFNPFGPGMYNAVARVPSPSAWEGAGAQSIEDFIYTAAGPVGAVIIHMDAPQGGMETLIDGMKVIDHIKSVLVAIRHRAGGACALHIGNTVPVLAALQAEFNACVANNVVVNEQGHRHMGGFHAAFNNFVTAYATVVVMGFDADVCVRANLFGATEYAANPQAGDSSLTPITGQADVVTSRAVLVTPGTIGTAEYGVLRGL